MSSRQQYADRQELNKARIKNESFNMKKSRPKRNILNEPEPNEEIKETNILDENIKWNQKPNDDYE